MAFVRPNSTGTPSEQAGLQPSGGPHRSGGKPAPKSIWLNGEVLACACPDCGAPIAIRAWLMLGDCIRCGTSVELTEEQEREARRLLDERALRTGKPAAITENLKKGVETPAEPQTAPLQRPVAPAIPSPPPVPRRPLPAYVKPESDYDWLRDLPAWLVSLVVHLVLMMLLGLWTVKPEDDNPQIVLSAVYGTKHREGEPGIYDPKVDEVVFEDPGKPPDNETPREAAARKEAEELRLPSDKKEPPRPKLSAVVAALSKPADSRMFEGRDPRIRTTVLDREGGTSLTEAAVARGVRWLSKHQASNGSWSLSDFHRAGDCNGQCRGQGNHESDTGATALALLPLLGAGQTHLHGRYSDTVKGGLAYLLNQQQRDGSLIGQGNGQMYAHAISTIVLCEAYALTSDRDLYDPAERAVSFIVRAQHRRGGWRYAPNQPGDTSVIGWQLMALRSAKMAGFAVPEETFESAGRYLDHAAADELGATYSYQPAGGRTPTMTAEGLLCREYLGWPKDHPGLQTGVQLLVRDCLPSRAEPNIYMWYYATQVLHHFGGEEWTQWNTAIRTALLEMQETQGHEAGSWDPRGGVSTIGNVDVAAGGRIYMTALAICTLEVYYRHLPIYRSIELK